MDDAFKLGTKVPDDDLDLYICNSDPYYIVHYIVQYVLYCNHLPRYVRYVQYY